MREKNHKLKAKARLSQDHYRKIPQTKERHIYIDKRNSKNTKLKLPEKKILMTYHN